MQNVNNSGSTNIAALAAAVLGSAPSTNAGGTAVMERPVAAPRKRRNRASTAAAAILAAAVVAAPMAVEAAPVVDAKTEAALGLTPGTTAAVNADYTGFTRFDP